ALNGGDYVKILLKDAKAAGIPLTQPTAYRYLRKMQGSGLVENEGGKYRISDPAKDNGSSKFILLPREMACKVVKEVDREVPAEQLDRMPTLKKSVLSWRPTKPKAVGPAGVPVAAG
ncbi:MAG: hypothetical protein IIB66_08995, partial [Proteobacteria bacterium]|nr:hypothetical protein [Pseudomonadota bacterium]